MNLIKIDLHIHTKSTKKDADFIFDMDVLKEFVETNDLDVIAITNHNLFDKEQYYEIVSNFDNCIVLPGIEIDYLGGHILVIADNNENSVNQFSDKCLKITQFFDSDNERKDINREELNNVFINLDQYLIIPHYDKDKRDLTLDKITALDPSIKWGEVANYKKFIRAQKNDKALTPLLFSDFRPMKVSDDSKISEQEKKIFPNRYTYIDLNKDELSINKMKLCFQSKDRIYLNKDKETSFFYALNENVKIVDGLNVAIGRRSSGKTYLLESINKSSQVKYSNNLVKYIKQFQITNESNEDKILNILESNANEMTNSFMEEMEEYIKHVAGLDYDKAETELESYVSSLLKHASDQELADIYSSCILFNEPDDLGINSDETLNLIDAIYKLKSTEKHKELVKKHIELSHLNNLFDELLLIYHEELLENKAVELANKWSKSISEELQGESSHTAITSYNLINHFKILTETILFENFIKSFDKDLIIYEDNFYDKFFQKTYITKNQNIDELLSSTKYSPKKHFSKKEASNNKKLIEQPFIYLKEIMANTEIDKNSFQLYRLFFRVENKVSNIKGTGLSGGERAELNLLHHLKEAKKSDILLIDEIEPSFDNLYINLELLKIIKEIAKDTIVVISTHNNSLGVLLEPQNLIYTDYYDDEKEETVYKQYYGHFNDDLLKSISGEEMSTRQIYIEMMEGGDEAYDKRGEIYESFNR